MYGNLPESQDNIRRDLVQRFIADRSTVEGQIDGCAAICAALWAVFAPMVGSVATRAVFVRAVRVAQDGHPVLAGLAVREDGPDFEGLKAKMAGLTPETSRVVLAALVVELFDVLYDLLGRALLPFLSDIEAELANGTGDARTDEEER